MKKLITILFLLLPLIGSACDEPIMGTKYDKLISIERSTNAVGRIQYNIRLPHEVENHVFETAELILNEEFWIPLNLTKLDKDVVGRFELKESVQGKINVVIVWGGEQACVIFGTAVIERNQTMKNDAA